jgi:Ni/Co efflux regulator RcnB
MVSIKKLLAIALTTLSLGAATSALANDRPHGSGYSSHPYTMQVDHRHYGDRHYHKQPPRYRHHGGRNKPHYYSDHRRYDRHHRWDRRGDSHRRYYRSRDVW